MSTFVETLEQGKRYKNNENNGEEDNEVDEFLHKYPTHDHINYFRPVARLSDGSKYTELVPRFVTVPGLNSLARESPAVDIFLRYARGEKQPPLTHPIDPRIERQNGYFVKGDGFVGFRGVGKADLASIWHMLMVPEEKIPWVADLTPEHLPLLERMRDGALQFVKHNKSYFIKKHGKSARKWLEPRHVQLGFHLVPTVGQLHLHALVGPLTKFGADERNVKKWVSLETVMNYLREGKTGQDLLDDILIQWRPQKKEDWEWERRSPVRFWKRALFTILVIGIIIAIIVKLRK